MQRVGVGVRCECRLLGQWANAAKYEQMVLERMKETKAEEAAIKESEEKMKEYNTKAMMQMSMKSILG